MDLTLARVLLFGLSLAGIPLLVFAIKLVRGVFTGEIVAELPYTQKEAPFSIATAGTYAIWQKAPLLARTPVGEFRPEVRSSPSGRPLRLRASWMRPSVNNGMTGRMELFRFFAPAGDYTIAFGEGASVSKVELALSALLPIRKSALPADYSLQVTKARSAFVLLAGIFLILIAAGCILGGFVLGLSAHQFVGQAATALTR
ncbi:hypothetical protein J2732_003278 [Achromobacter deleyi]|uniref:hypothetical protein n=1 Tax=Achromobacter deleyi TaxID=1353891 RepID=UPI00285D6297|nr:hypothetical protein [Achromobacter deleyi]MDR6602273.1 hypothetical protein [Achromobacter deleyi]